MEAGTPIPVACLKAGLGTYLQDVPASHLPADYPTSFSGPFVALSPWEGEGRTSYMN